MTDKAFVKGLRLIEAMAASDGPRGVTDLSRQLDLTKSNVHRLLTTLSTHGYIRQDPDSSGYELTTKLWELGGKVVGRLDLTRVARPAMERLAALTGETVHLSLLENEDVVYLDKIDSSHHIRAHTSVGQRAPAYTMATGKAMLSTQPDAYLERYRNRLQPFTGHTVTTMDALYRDIEEVRQKGYAQVLHGQWRSGIAACACAIRGPLGDLAGAIGVSGPDTRVQQAELDAFAPHVVAAAQAISRALGYTAD
ncbi:IclR family transcriptional regulator [Aquicoccus sp. SU-CL01552]|uniref:IclR family transcriptional regulator n=1 Tax=Aquicoccus sp. SU-CL01552 TaxID=3127656 RepID=UPI00333EA974